MKVLKHMKDGGPDSNVSGYFLVEIKSLFSVVLLHFSQGSREAYHSHAFGAISWLIKGKLREFVLTGKPVALGSTKGYSPSFKPITTPRSRFHKVFSVGDSWALSFRGPWKKNWQEYLPKTGETVILTHGRKVVS